MNGSIVCPKCQHQNKADATKCEQCGTNLVNGAIETLRFADLPELSRGQWKPAYQGKVMPGFIAVYVMDEAEPLVAAQKGTLTMGRSALGEEIPTINLTRFHAGLLGVSRRHAAIQINDNDHTLTDLNSSNGTWVNEERLVPGKPHPLRSGDTVRLGHLVVHIYFEEKAPAAAAQPEPSAPARLTTSELGEVRSATVRVVGRPGAIEQRPDQVIIRMLHLAPGPVASDAIAPPPPTRFTIYLSTAQWEEVRGSLTQPDNMLVIEGACAYGKESAGILVYAKHVSIALPANNGVPTAP